MIPDYMYAISEPAPAVTLWTDPESDPVGYIRQKWGEFVGLSPRIIDAQHRAALVSAEANRRGDLELAGQARASVEDLARLQQIHDFAVRKIEAVAGLVGLGSLGAVPFIVAAPLAALMVWVLAHYYTQLRVIRGLEAGTIDGDAIRALDELGPDPAGLLGGAADLGKVLLWGALAFFAYQLVQSGAFKRNPPLVVWESNPPPHLIGEDVYDVWYRHAEDGDHYVHEFEGGVEMWGEGDGSVRFVHPTKPLWRDFS